MKRISSSTLVAMIVVATAGTALAQPCPCGGPGPGWGGGAAGPGPGPGFGPRAMFRCILDAPDLGLTADQRKTIEGILEEAREQAQDVREQNQDLRDQFLKSFADPTVTAEQLRELAKNLRRQHEQMMDRHLEVSLKVRAVLTPEQLSRVPSIVEKCHPGPHGRPMKGRNR